MPLSSILNAYPYVIFPYHDFDGLMKQIVHIKPLATPPSRQMIDDKLPLLAGQNLGHGTG